MTGMKGQKAHVRVARRPNFGAGAPAPTQPPW